MLVINLTILCCLFTFGHDRIGGNALTYNLQDKKTISLDHRNYRNKAAINIHVTRTPKKPPRPMKISLEPFGAIEMASLTNGKIEINTEAFTQLVGTLTSETTSRLPDLYNYLSSSPDLYSYLPSLPDLYPNLSYLNNLYTTNNEDSSREEPDDSFNPSSNQNDKSASREKSDENDSKKNENNSRQTRQDRSGNESRKTSQESKRPERENQSKNSGGKDAENNDPTEPPQSSYIPDFATFQKYYPYARPLIKSASLFFPGIGQYQQVMFGLEMADLAWKTASMYSNGDGVLSVGWFLGKEAFSRLGRRDESTGNIVDHKSPVAYIDMSSMDNATFLETVKNTEYPPLNDEQEFELEQKVFDIAEKYFHEHENYNDNIEMTKFVHTMTLCVKFIALHEIIPMMNQLEPHK